MGELSQVAIGGAEAGVVAESNYRRLANHVVLGLTAIYKRFNLKQGQLILTLQPDQTMYALQSKFAVTGKNSSATIRYIADTVTSPFRDDIIKIQGVTSDSGFSFNLNDYTDDYSITTPTLDSLRVPLDIVNPPNDLPKEYLTKQLVVDYDANHPNFLPKVGFFDPELTNIELPDAYTQALLYFVASRVHNPIGMGQEFNAGNNWAARYEQECLRLENDGIEINNLGGNTRAERGGWC